MQVGCAPLLDTEGPIKMDPGNNTEGSESWGLVGTAFTKTRPELKAFEMLISSRGCCSTEW